MDFSSSFAAKENNFPVTYEIFLIIFLYSELSDISSAIISQAPSMASLKFNTPFSMFIYSLAIFSILSSFIFCFNIIFAKGSNPFSFAWVALVLFLGLNGL